MLLSLDSHCTYNGIEIAAKLIQQVYILAYVIYESNCQNYKRTWLTYVVGNGHGSLEQAFVLAPSNSNNIKEYASSGTTSHGPKELMAILIEEINGYVHAKDSCHHNECTDHKCGRRQHHPHLKKVVLFVIQHNVDVVLCVIHILPKLRCKGKYNLAD